MMMAKPTTSEEDTTSAATTTEAPAAAPNRKLPASTEDALKELEERLLRLDGSDGNDATSKSETIAEPPKQAPPPPPPPAPPAAAAAAGGGGKSALLARIMAAQERAKQAQQQKKPAATTSEGMTETEKMMRALNGESAAEAVAPPSIDDTPPPPPPPFEAAVAAPPPPPPPQIDFIAPTGPAPPSFAAVEQKVMQQVSAKVPTPSAPSAPPIDFLQPATGPATANHLAGIQPVAPPTQTPPPPSFEQFEAQADEELFQFDLEGNALSPEQRQEMMEEQRKILAQIKKDASRSAASAASAAADAFDSRSATAAAAAASTADRVGSSGGGAATAGEEVIDVGVKQGESGAVEVEGQEKVFAAIREGSAKLTQCTSCEAWLQVTQAATLLFCPLCNTVSLVMGPDGQVREASGPKSADEELAEQLQKQEYEEAERARRSQQQRRAERATQQQKSSSWWDTIFGSSATASNGTAQTTSVPPPTSSRGPGLVSANTGAETDSQHYYSPTVPAADPSMLPSAQTGEEERSAYRGPSTYERDNLLDGGTTRGGARIAEKKPLFACMVDGVTEAANSFSTALTARTLEEDGEGNVHGVDGSSLLVTRAGREPSGRYNQIPDGE